jgi:hypothetical protein
LLVSLIVLVPTDNCQGPLRGAFLDLAQDVCFFGPAGALLYSISVIALISLAKDPQGTLAINSVERRG